MSPIFGLIIHLSKWTFVLHQIQSSAITCSAVSLLANSNNNLQPPSRKYSNHKFVSSFIGQNPHFRQGSTIISLILEHQTKLLCRNSLWVFGALLIQMISLSFSLINVFLTLTPSHLLFDHLKLLIASAKETLLSISLY